MAQRRADDEPCEGSPSKRARRAAPAPTVAPAGRSARPARGRFRSECARVAALARCGEAGSPSVVEVFDELAERLPDAPAVEELDSRPGQLAPSFSWSQLREASCVVAAGLQTALADAADRRPVAILAPRSREWLAATVAVLRCSRSFVWLSAREGALASEAREEKRRVRNAAVLRIAESRLVLLGGGADLAADVGDPETNGRTTPAPLALQISALLSLRSSGIPWATGLSPPDGSVPLCLMFSGGSTGEPKCIVATHAMAMHEVNAYPAVVPELDSRDRVLQQTSVFWAASAWGQVDIALAVGAALCVSASGTPPPRLLRGAGVTVLGAAPSALAAYVPGDVPSLRCVFTWGEAMPAALAQRFRSGGVRIVELLISTEYWLTFVGGGGGGVPGSPQTVFEAISGLDFGVLPTEAIASADAGELDAGALRRDAGAVGELCLRGPAVMRAYLQDGAERRDPRSFLHAGDGPYFRARDIVRITGSGARRGVQFCGRSDSLIKVGAEFVNLADVERRLEALPECGGVAACLLPQQVPGRGTGTHAFIAPRSGAPPVDELAALVRQVRAILPHGSIIHLMARLPLDAVTGKVQRRALAERIALAERSSEPVEDWEQRAILWKLVWRYPLWWSVVVACCFAEVLICSVMAWSLEPAEASMLYRTSLARLTGLPYLWLCTVHALPNRCTDLAPFGRIGIVMPFLVLLTWRLPAAASPWGDAACLLVCAAGLLRAARSDRLLAWMVAFWVCVPNTLHADAAWWAAWRTWLWWLRQGLWNTPAKLHEAFLDAPQFAALRGAAARCGLAPASPEARAAAFRAGDWVQVWSLAQQIWLDGHVNRVAGAWVAVSYRWPSGSMYDKELRADDPQLRRPGLLARWLRSCRRRPKAAAAAPAAPSAPGGSWSSAARAAWAAPQPAADGAAWREDQAAKSTWRSWGAWGQDAGGQEGAAALRYRGYTLQEWRRWEKQWWDECTFDSIDVYTPWCTPQEEAAPMDLVAGAGATTNGADAGPRAAPAAMPPFLARVVRLVEQHLHLPGIDVDTSLAGADSLSFMALCRAFRGDLGRELQPEVAMRCSTPRDLCRSLEDAPLSCSGAPVGPESDQGGPAGGSRYAIYFAPSQWKGRCAWLYEAEGLLDARAFEAAAGSMIGRHEALRYTLSDPPELLPFVSFGAGLNAVLAGYVLDRVQHVAPALLRRSLDFLVRRLQELVAFGLKGAWPRVGPGRPGSVRVERCTSWGDVQDRMRAQSLEYVTPFSVGLYLMEGGGDGGRWTAPRSFVYFICTHAFSDGFTCFPLISDLSELYEWELARRRRMALEAAGAGAAADDGDRPVPLPPSAFQVLQQRLFSGLDAQPLLDAPEQVSFRSTDFWLPPPEPQPAQYFHHVVFEPRALEGLRSCGKNFAIPIDVVLLGAVTVALFRAGVCDDRGRLTGADASLAAEGALQHLTMALYAPMRDGASNEAMVGLFSDWREVSISAERGGCITVLGLVLELAARIRSRRWVKFDAMQNSARCLVNILALDEKPRGASAFRQTREHEYSSEKFRRGTRRPWRANALRPMRLTLEQYELSTWWLAMDLSDDAFPPAWCRRFVAALSNTVHDMLLQPLRPVL